MIYKANMMKGSSSKRISSLMLVILILLNTKGVRRKDYNHLLSSLLKGNTSILIIMKMRRVAVKVVGAEDANNMDITLKLAKPQYNNLGLEIWNFIRLVFIEILVY